MIEVKYGTLPDEALINYLNFLVGKFFKILPLKEQREETLLSYLESLQREMIGNKSLIPVLKKHPDFITLLNTLEYFITHKDADHAVYKKEVFKCINIIKKLQRDILSRGGEPDGMV